MLYCIVQCEQIKVIAFRALHTVRGDRSLETANKERFFSVELKSKGDLKSVTLSNGSHDRVLVEGNIGVLVHAGFVEDVILEIVGTSGILRINLEKSELKKQEVTAYGST